MSFVMLYIQSYVGRGMPLTSNTQREGLALKLCQQQTRNDTARHGSNWQSENASNRQSKLDSRRVQIRPIAVLQAVRDDDHATRAQHPEHRLCGLTTRLQGTNEGCGGVTSGKGLMSGVCIRSRIVRNRGCPPQQELGCYRPGLRACLVTIACREEDGDNCVSRMGL